MGFGIVACFPLGKYVGHFDQQVEAVPSPARLLSALLCAAGQGTRAREIDGRLTLSDEDASALRWLESNPPMGVAIPRITFSQTQAIAYRNLGLRSVVPVGSDRVTKIKKPQKRAQRGTAVGGEVGWAWDEEPPEDVRSVIEALCGDVAYLGSSESPVRLRVDDVEPTHRAVEGASLFDPCGIAVEVPKKGRVDALVSAHAERASQVPTARADRVGSDEDDSPPPRCTSGLASMRYEEATSDRLALDLPWDRALLVEVRPGPDISGSAWDVEMAEDHRVAWCVALHRALISVIGFGAPPMITGRYVGPAPSNHLAIQLTNQTQHMSVGPASQHSFIFMIPREADPADVAALITALSRIRVLGRRRSDARLRLEVASPVLPAGGFWSPPAPNTFRAWETAPLAIPDTRFVRLPGWSWADAARLSVAMAWRDFVEVPDGPPSRAGVRRNDAKYVKLADAVLERGVEVLDARPVVVPDPSAYVHRVSNGSLVRPYRAVLSMGDLHSPSGLAAIGQSRHLGTGLLVPRDIPQETEIDGDTDASH